MLPYYSGVIPVVLASAGINVSEIDSLASNIPTIGPALATSLENAVHNLNGLMSSMNMPAFNSQLDCTLAANIGQGSWVPNIECGGMPLGLLQPQAYSFTASQSGRVCGLNASFGNIAALNLSTNVAYITAHVEIRRPSCASIDEQVWTDITPIDPNTGCRGITLKNQGDNAFCACGDGILPPGAIGNTYTTPGCQTVPFCEENSRINCGDLIRVVFKATVKDSTDSSFILIAGFASAGLCILPDPITDPDCGCGCPCDNGYNTPKCLEINCKDCEEPTI